MLVIKIKKENKVVGEIKYKNNDLNKLGINVENMANKNYWLTVVNVIAEAIFKNYEDVNSIFAYDSKYEDLAHIAEINNKKEQLPAYYDWDYEPTEEEINGEPINCEEF